MSIEQRDDEQQQQQQITRAAITGAAITARSPAAPAAPTHQQHASMSGDPYATRMATAMLRARIAWYRDFPAPADAWLMDAALHVEGRRITLDRASTVWPDAR